MKEKHWNYLPIYHWQDQRIKKTIAFLVLMVFSITILHNILVSPRTHAHTYEVLDQQKETVTALLVASTAMSTVISTIPEDTSIKHKDGNITHHQFFPLASPISTLKAS